MSYQTADAKREFDSWSNGYDRNLLQWIFFGPSHRMLLEEIDNSHERILDVGCGTGIFAAKALQHFPDAQVWGMDLSDGMLRQCRARCEAAEGRLHLVQGDSQRLPFADDSFDVITCTHSFHHYPKQQKAVSEMHRVLRPGGKLLIIDGDRDRAWGWLIYDVIVVMAEGAVRHLTSGAFREMYEDVGFAEVSHRRRRGLLPILMTIGTAVKTAKPAITRRAA